MTAADPDRENKIDRELRLGWQSHWMLASVLLVSSAGLIGRLLPILTPANAEGLAICAAFGLLVWLLHAATPLGALTGFILTSCLYVSTVEQPRGGWFHTALLPGLALFVVAFAATRFRRAQKEQIGVAESRRGRRASQVAANMGIAALAALMVPPYTHEGSGFTHVLAGIHIGRLVIVSSAILTAMIAALAEAAADTVSSEMGQAIGGTPVLITNGHRVPPGTDGAITLAGTAAGCLAAAVVVFTTVPTLRLNPRQAALAWIAAVAGLFADSLIGATLERRGWLDNDSVNFLSTAVAALIALVA